MFSYVKLSPSNSKEKYNQIVGRVIFKEECWCFPITIHVLLTLRHLWTVPYDSCHFLSFTYFFPTSLVFIVKLTLALTNLVKFLIYTKIKWNQYQNRRWAARYFFYLSFILYLAWLLLLSLTSEWSKSYLWNTIWYYTIVFMGFFQGLKVSHILTCLVFSVL